VIRGVMLNKDVTHPSMRRRIEHPRIVLLDCGLDYKQAESVAHLEISAAEDWDKALKNEEASVRAMCEAVIAVKPDLVITEKGVSDLAQHYLQRANITALRRVRKSDNNRLAKATGATIVHRPEELLESDVGSCGLFEVRQIGDEYFAFVEDCASPKACSVLLRGGSKDALNEIERNLQDAMQVARNVVFDPRVLPGGGATEMEVACRLQRRAKEMGGVESLPFAAVGEAMEVIPRTLCQNCGADTIRVITKLRVGKRGVCDVGGA
jgi:T-complex protein 1 subunit gamma